MPTKTPSLPRLATLALGLLAMATATTPVAGQQAEPVGTLEKHDDQAYAVCWTPDGRTIVSVGFDRMLRIWDAETLEQRAAIVAHEELALCVAVSPDGTRIATGGQDKLVKIWSMPGADADADPEAEANPEAEAEADPEAPVEPLATMTGHEAQVYAVAFSPDGSRLASAGADKSLRIWDVGSGEAIRTIAEAHEAITYAVAFHPTADLIVSAGDDRVIKFWCPVEAEDTAEEGAPAEPAEGDAPAEEGAEEESGQMTAEGHEAAVYRLAFSPDGSTLASCSVDKTVRLWNVEDGSERRVLSGHPDDVYAVAWSPDGARLASIGYGGQLLIWDPSADEPASRQRVAPETRASDLAFSPDGRRLAVAASDGLVYLFAIP